MLRNEKLAWHIASTSSQNLDTSQSAQEDNSADLMKGDATATRGIFCLRTRKRFVTGNENCQNSQPERT